MATLTRGAMFSKILVANRGEIACRVMRTARRLGVQTVAVYSEADCLAPHVSMADEAYCIGPAAASDSYLRSDAILEACKKSDAEAVHPGYGFLSENAAFAQACDDAGVVFIGPPVPAITAMGSKSASKEIMELADVPLTPGYHGEEQDAEFLLAKADGIGYPLLIKAVMGGGGKGMRIVRNSSEFHAALESCQRESKKSFGDDRVLLERFLTEPRHVEVQVFGDTHGNVVYLHERDCSLQRRHQKVLEEAPAPGLTQAQREYVGQAAVKAAKAVDYVGAGTVEFLQDGPTGDFFFCEMNTRLQVEHPVTEEITKLDLVEWQLKVAAGQSLPICEQDAIPGPFGHAIEARVYAENPLGKFLPATGLLQRHRPPVGLEGVRVDAGVQEGGEVSMFYDPMISKLIAWGENRTLALQRLDEALAKYEIVGLHNNLQFLKAAAGHSAFVNGTASTGFLDQSGESIVETLRTPAPRDVRALACLAVVSSMDGRIGHKGDLRQFAGFRIHSSAQTDVSLVDVDFHDVSNAENAEKISVVRENDGSYRMSGFAMLGSESDEELVLQGHLDTDSNLKAEVGGRLYQARFVVSTPLSDMREGADVWISIPGGAAHGVSGEPGFRTSWKFRVPKQETKTEGSIGGDLANIIAPMPGRLIALKVHEGQHVQAGEPLAVLEAMKMEHVLTAPADAVVGAVCCQVGDAVTDGMLLISLESPAESSGVVA